MAEKSENTGNLIHGEPYPFWVLLPEYLQPTEGGTHEWIGLPEDMLEGFDDDTIEAMDHLGQWLHKIFPGMTERQIRMRVFRHLIYKDIVDKWIEFDKSEQQREEDFRRQFPDKPFQRWYE